MPTDIGLYILDLAKRAPQPGRGRREASGRAKIREAMILSVARAHKRRLRAEGKTAEDASELAAEEAARKLGIATSTIRRRMQSKSRQ